MEMSKSVKALIIILGIVVIPFFIYKVCKLSEYNQYPGKIIDIEKVNVSHPRKGGGYDNEVRYLPVVEYYSPKDTSSFSEGKRNLFAFYDIGDEVTVIERKDDTYKSSIFSFWYYFVSTPEIIVMMLIIFVSFGFYRTFIKKNPEF
jgi:hypothetical protein